MNILKLQKMVSRFVKATDQERRNLPSINQMMIVMLVYRKVAVTHSDLTAMTVINYASMRKLTNSLRNGESSSRTGYQFLDAKFIKGTHIVELFLTANGKKFARIIAPFFGD